MPRLDAIGVIVFDLTRSAAFYRHVGLRFPEPVDPEGHGHAEAELENGLRFMLDTEAGIREFDPGWTQPSGGHRVAAAFLCESPAEVDRVFKELVRAGGKPHREPWDAFWGQRYAQVHDPDGNVVDLFAALPNA
jgi:uncharacterized glyoxalase superfamily protein PhnB